ncbi:MAG: hypothetical protein ABIQ47_18105 [Tepidiformaceae bacterium]
MGGAQEGAAVAVEPEKLVFRLRWSEIQRLNRARQTSGSRWAADARWRIYPLMLVIFAAYWWLNVGFGRTWLLGVLLAGIAATAFLAFPMLFSGWARLPVLHWTIFDPVNLLLRRTVEVDGAGMTVRGWRGELTVAWNEFEGNERSAVGLTLQKGLQAWYLPARAFRSHDSFDVYSRLAAHAVNVTPRANVV